MQTETRRAARPMFCRPTFARQPSEKPHATRVRAALLLVVGLTLGLPAASFAEDCRGESEEFNWFEWSGKIDDFAAKLGSSITAERAQAARCLVHFPARLATPLLLEALKDEATEVQVAALEALRDLGARGVTAAVVKLSESRDVELRIAAAQALGFVGDHSAVSPLTTLLDDPSGDVRKAAVESLGRLRDPNSISGISAKLDDDVKEVVVAALNELATFGDPSTVYAILDMTEDSSIKVRKAAVIALGKLGDPRATSTLLSMLVGQPSEVQRAVMEAVVDIGDPRAVDSLHALLNPNNGDETLVQVMRALGRLGDPSSVAPLLTFLRHDQQSNVARSAIADIGEPAVDALISELETTENVEYQRQLLGLLATIPSPRSAATLQDALNSDRFPRDQVVLAVAQIRDPSMLETLTLVIPELTEVELLKVVRRVSGVADDRLSRPLLDRYPKLSKEARKEVLLLFAAMKDPQTLATTIEETGNEDLEVQRLAIYAASQIGGPEAVDALALGLESDDRRVRRQAALGLATIPGKRTVDLLLKVAKKKTHPAQREAIWALAQALRGQESSDALELARDILEAKDETNSYVALELIATLQPEDVLELLQPVYADGRTSVRRKVMEVVGFMKLAGTEEMVADALSSEDPMLRAEAAWTAGRVGLTSQIATLTQLVEDPYSPTAANAIAALGTLDAKDAAPIVLQRLNDRSPFVAANVVWALERMGAPVSTWELELLLPRSENPFLRESIYRVLLARGEEETLTRLLARESNAALLAAVSDVRSSKVSKDDSWVIIDVSRPIDTKKDIDESVDERLIGQRVFLLLPDGAVKGAHSDENGKVRMELDEAGPVKQLYDDHPFIEFANSH